MGESRSLKKSIVMLNRRISCRNSGIMYELDTKHCQRIVDVLNLKQAKTVGSPAVKENVIDFQRGECSWESLQKDPTQWESTGEHLGEEKARVYRSTVARLNYRAVDRPDLQHAVRVCSKAAAKPIADDWLKLKRFGRYVEGSPHIGIMFAWQKAPIKLTVQSDSDWAGERKTRKSVSSGNIRFGHHLLRSWSKDQSVIALSSGEAELYAACMSAQQAMGIESMAREQGVDLDAMELQVDANAAIGIIGRQGQGKVRHLDLSYLWLQAAVWGKQVVLRKVQSGDNVADIGTMVRDRDTIQRHMENLGCVRFDQ